MEKVNDDVAATTGKNKAKEVVVIAGDSLIKNVVGASMSKTYPIITITSSKHSPVQIFLIWKISLNLSPENHPKNHPTCRDE
jgi:hypothetical protein